MSSSVGRILRDGVEIGVFKWSNTSDSAWSTVYATEEDMTARFKDRFDPDREYHRSGICAGTEPIAVTLVVDRKQWPGKVCPRCQTIIDGANPYGVE